MHCIIIIIINLYNFNTIPNISDHIWHTPNHFIISEKSRVFNVFRFINKTHSLQWTKMNILFIIIRVR